MKTVLIVGTGDTKALELDWLRRCVAREGAAALIMNVGVMGDPPFETGVSRHQVAAAAGATIDDLIALKSENLAMIRMAQGAVQITRDLFATGRIDALLALGGSMGTDLALDVAAALPIGVPKVVISTVAFSHMIPPERNAPDLMMMLWPGGLYGLNSLCETALAQAAGAVCGAMRLSPTDAKRPLVGITALGKSCLNYMVRLVPELEARGFEAAVFHATGMGGAAFEAVAAQGRFAAVMDFCTQEVTNHFCGSVISAGPERMKAAGLAGVPQLVAPGGLDMIDVPGSHVPARLRERALRPHNRLLWSALTTPDERSAVARLIADRLAEARAPVKLILPLRGVEEWDRPGDVHHDPDGLAAMIEAFRTRVRAPAELIELAAHINDDAFVDCALAQFDAWLAAGVVRRESARPRQAKGGDA